MGLGVYYMYDKHIDIYIDMPELRLKCLQLEIQLKIEQKRVEKNARSGKPVFGLTT